MDQGFLAQVEGLAVSSSLGDMFRDFQLLLNSMQNQPQPPPIDQILSEFQPEYDLHKLFKVKLVDQFKCAGALEEMLRSEDPLYAKRVVRCSWYFENIANVPTLVNETMPCLSFSTRTKVITAYSKNLKDSSPAEELFLALRRRYGLSKAMMILPACSEKFIRNLLRHIHVQLPAGVVLALYEKYPSLIVEFVTLILDHSSEFNRAFRNFDIRCYDGVFVKMASKDTKTFLSMFEKYHKKVPRLSLGRKIVKKLVKANVTSVIEKFQIYSRILKKNVLVGYLTIDQIRQLQLSVFPKTMTAFFKSQPRDLFLSVTSNLKPELAEDVLLKNFETAFGRKLTVDEFASVITYRMVGFLPVKQRAKWVEEALKSESNVKKQADYISILPVTDSFPRLQKLAQNQSDFNNRAVVLKRLVASVRNQKAFDSFAAAVGYIVERYRNDNVLLRSVVFDELSEFNELLLEIGEADWSVIIDLVNQVRLNGETNRFVHHISNILGRRIEGCFMRGEDVEPHLNLFCEVVLKELNNYDFDLCKGTPFHKQCLEWFIQNFQVLVREKRQEDVATKLFVSVNRHNANAKESIVIPDWLKTVIEEEIQKDVHFYKKRIIFDAVKHDMELKIWFCNLVFPKYCPPEVAIFLLKRQPLAIKSNAEAVVKAIVTKTFDDFRPFVRKTRLYSSYGVPQAIVEECQAVLKKSNSEEGLLPFSKPNAIQTMSLLMRPSDFFQVAQEFAPMSDKVGDYSEKVAALTKMQEAVALAIKYVNRPMQFLPLLRQFTKGDYLKFAVGTINSITLKVPEKIILPQLVEWLDCPVSLRKHFIRAYTTVAPIECTARLLVSLFEKEKNSSIRLVLFSRMFSLFSAEPNEDMFKAFKSFLMTLTSGDGEIMNRLFELKKVSDHYVSQYLEMLWDVTELKGGQMGLKGRNDIVDLIDREILSLLSDEFCETILRHIFSKQNLKNNGLFNFVCNYLFYNDIEAAQTNRLDIVFGYINSVFLESWDENTLLDYFVFPARKTMAYFVKSICTKSFELSDSPLKPLNLLTEFKSKLSAIVDSTHLLEEFILMDFAIFYHKYNLNEGNRITADALAQYLDAASHELVSSRGPLAVDFVKEAVPMHFLGTEDQIRVSEILLTRFTNESSHLLAVHLLPHVVNDESSLPHYEVIIASIMNSQYKSVQLMGCRLLKKMSSSVRVA